MFLSRHRGSTLVYTLGAMTALMGFVSLAVDYGRASNAESQLQSAVDAAARYAATGLSNSTYLAKAQASASENTVDGSALALLSADVESGTWNSTTKVFTPGGSSPNAVRVTGRRLAARGTAIPLTFARVVGANSVDMSCSAVATYSSAAVARDIVGLTSVSLTGSGIIRRWSSESGTVNVATNGTTSVPNGTFIQGNVYYRTSVPSEPGNGISGTSTSMGSDMTYTTPTIPGSAIDMGAVNIGWQGANVAGGVYKCTSITVGGGGAVTVTGNVDIYCSGAVDFGNGCTINTSGTNNKITLYLTTASTATFNMSSTYYMIIYGPLATVNLTGSSPMVGSILAKNLSIVGSANLNYSSALPLPTVGGGGGGTGGGATVSTVK